MEKNNIHLINYIKCLSLLLIYFNHSEIYSNRKRPSVLIYTDHYIGAAEALYHPVMVHAFFIVSGYLLFRKQLTIPSLVVATN